MNKFKRIGIIAIIIGIFIPSVLYPFTSLTTSALLISGAFARNGVAYKPRLNDLEVVIKKGTWLVDKNYQGHYEGRVAIPYPYAVAFGLTVVFLGIGLVVLAGQREAGSIRD